MTNSTVLDGLLTNVQWLKQLGANQRFQRLEAAILRSLSDLRLLGYLGFDPMWRNVTIRSICRTLCRRSSGFADPDLGQAQEVA